MNNVSIISFCTRVLSNPVGFLKIYFSEGKAVPYLKKIAKKIYWLSLPVIIFILILPVSFFSISIYVEMGGSLIRGVTTTLIIVLVFLLWGVIKMHFLRKITYHILLKSARSAGNTTSKEELSDLTTYLITCLILIILPALLIMGILLPIGVIVNKELILNKEWAALLNSVFKPSLILLALYILSIFKWISVCRSAIFDRISMNPKKVALSYSLRWVGFIILWIGIAISLLMFLIKNGYII